MNATDELPNAATRSSSPVLWGTTVYFLLLAVALVLFWLICQQGEKLSAPAVHDAGAARKEAIDVPHHLMATMAAVIGLGYVLGRVLRWVGQPPVIGEVLAGIMLGPSLLGAVWSAGMDYLVPGPASDPARQVAAAVQGVASLGLVLYMFLIGLELNGARLRKQVHSVVAISHSSIVLPFLLGGLLALWIYPIVSSPTVSFTGFALFMGAAMSITAFPILARILTDRRLEKTSLGVVALGCAAADDVTAWCLLALVVGVVRSNVSSAAVVLIMTMAFIATMFLVIKPMLARWIARWEDRPGSLPVSVVMLTFVALLVSALVTHSIGIHAVFGAFLLGAIVPSESRLAKSMTLTLRDPVIYLLLPAFFASTGLRTELGLVAGLENILVTAGIVGVAIAGKFLGATLASRATGGSWSLSAALGVLMNTRGLMELIVLHIGLDLGIIGPKLFAMMVIMAIVTTVMTSPILAMIVRNSPDEPAFRSEA